MATLKAKTSYERPTSRPASPFKAPSQPGVQTRPKAKVNTSATFGPRKLTTSSLSPTARGSATSVNSTPRAPSPFKSTQRSDNKSSPPYQPIKARVNASAVLPSTSLRPSPTSPHLSHSTPSSPDSNKQRHSSLTVHHSKSTISLASRTVQNSPLVPAKLPPDVDTYGAGPSTGRHSRTPSRVTSKVTQISMSPPPPELPGASIPLSVPSRSTFTRSRVPSVSSMSIFSSSPSSGSSLPHSVSGNVIEHKRNNSQTKIEQIQQHPVDGDQTIHRGAYNHKFVNNVHTVAKVDRALTPVPLPHSPPTSSVSFSSHSSRSSVTSYDTQFSARSGGATSLIKESLSNGLYGTLTGDVGPIRAMSYNNSREGSPTTSEGDGPDDRRMQAEAKSIRKIADLEITNRSLMVINATLEASKHRQAKEIRDLRRKLRESRLILPPKTFRQMESTLDHDDTADEDDDDNDDDQDIDDLDDANFTGDKDEGFKRVRDMLEGLLDQGRRALNTKPDDLEQGSKSTTKVLHIEELRTWRSLEESGSRTPSIVNDRHSDSDDIGERLYEQSEADTSLQDDSHESEDEVEGMVSIKITPS